MNILLSADESAGLHTFRLLMNSRHRVTGVVTPPEHPQIPKLAKDNQIPVINPEKLTHPSFANWIRRHNVDVLLNVHLLYIVHPEVISAVSTGAFNLHPGPLPEYAGLNTSSWAIYNQEKQHGVTLHWMEANIDTGPIAFKKTFPIASDATGLTLSTRCAKMGLKLIKKLLEALEAEETAIPRFPQDISKRQYFGKDERPQNGYLDWTCPAGKIEAFIRACSYSPFESPWGFPKTSYKSSEIEIVSVQLTDEPCYEKPGTIENVKNKEVRVAADDNWLRIQNCRIDDEFYPAAEILKDGSFDMDYEKHLATADFT